VRADHYEPAIREVNLDVVMWESCMAAVAKTETNVPYRLNHNMFCAGGAGGHDACQVRRPNYLGLVTLTSFGWDDKPRSSVCTHSEHQARTTVSKQDCGNIQKAACTVYPVWSLPVILKSWAWAGKKEGKLIDTDILNSFWAVFTLGGSGPAITGYGSLDLKQEFKFKLFFLIVTFDIKLTNYRKFLIDGSQPSTPSTF
jgi:hypothetical protein